jgi:NADH-quinone oxidoreductase subunit L
MLTITQLLPILIIPVLSFLLCLMPGQFMVRKAGIISTLLAGVNVVFCCYVASIYFRGAASGSVVNVTSFPWLVFDSRLSISMGIDVSGLSAMMLVVISVVTLMVEWFSVGYMKGEPRFRIYYAFLSLFSFSMLGLVLSSNVLQLYMFWELVGLSSYLLIGFYYERPSAIAAAKKAFIVTRFADFGFLIGILILGFYTRSFDIHVMTQNVLIGGLPTTTGHAWSMLDWGLLLVFIGGAGKSAMFPLHIWLPDAMEGPTPVSALIHAATMVVAGVFLVARIFPMFAYADPDVLAIVRYVGLGSAVFAAVIACTQTDIKRVLAYSTMSQIGYMMFSLGISVDGSGYVPALFHLFTHAFFKSLLFLCAGSIIHYVHSNEVSAMGGLRKHMPLTNLCFLIGCLAIAGIPPLSGFFSKEAILYEAFRHDKFAYALALATAGLTAFYMFRLYFLIFWHRPAQSNARAHETMSMKIPVIILATLSVFAGLVPLEDMLHSVEALTGEGPHLAFSILPVGVALSGIALALFLFMKDRQRTTVSSSLSRLIKNRFYIDEVYLFFTKQIIFHGIAQPIAWIDRHIVDSTVVAAGSVTQRCSRLIRRWQSGKLQAYNLYFFLGILGIVFCLMIKSIVKA